MSVTAGGAFIGKRSAFWAGWVRARRQTPASGGVWGGEEERLTRPPRPPRRWCALVGTAYERPPDQKPAAGRLQPTLPLARRLSADADAPDAQARPGEEGRQVLLWISDTTGYFGLEQERGEDSQMVDSKD